VLREIVRKIRRGQMDLFLEKGGPDDAADKNGKP